ncbi:hypothetical protein BTO13_02425 [Polaribacter gangjinensis]|uniref:Carboxypeptidase-like regulatory domain-containing protein n=1 Tax=Polaribacter gangjinensis TaxID=574710 RepID=A0A2S7W999_9FLAO|nr:hypothetical protein BTO13_02425 [Polaribacter gangjinensis]
MILKRLFFSCFILMNLTFFAQKKNIILSGKVIDSLGIVKNANIINLNTSLGTFSNDEGLFRIFVSEGDSIQFSSIQHYTKKIEINKDLLAKKYIEITLTASTYILDEFELRKHNLTGRLGIDTKNVPLDKRDSILKIVMDFSKVNMKIVEGDDHIDAKVRPPIANTDPTARFAGAGATANIAFKYSEKMWALRKELERKKAFPFKLLSELGDKFFFDDLKIPLDNYFHFLEYCNPLGIEKLHKEGKLLEVIKILKTESVTYLKIIKNE